MTIHALYALAETAQQADETAQQADEIAEIPVSGISAGYVPVDCRSNAYAEGTAAYLRDHGYSGASHLTGTNTVLVPLDQVIAAAPVKAA